MGLKQSLILARATPLRPDPAGFANQNQSVGVKGLGHL